MATKQQVLKLAEKMGVEIELTIDSDMYDSDAWAPNGKKFKANWAHCVCTHHNAGYGLGDFYAQVLEDLKEGLVGCDETDCEHCE